MAAFHMATFEPPATTEAIADAYEASEGFISDALDWAATHAWEHPALVELAADYYRESAEFATKVDDIADGEAEIVGRR